jgi:hypothetical protein
VDTLAAGCHLDAFSTARKNTSCSRSSAAAELLTKRRRKFHSGRSWRRTNSANASTSPLPYAVMSSSSVVMRPGVDRRR